MKPGKKDIPIKIKIVGKQLEELQYHTVHMSEAYGLDTRIEKYQGTKSITLYQWDLDCLIDVLFIVLDDEKEYPDKKSPNYIALNKLYNNLKQVYKDTY